MQDDGTCNRAISTGLPGKLKVAKLNVDENPESAGKRSNEHTYVILFKNGEATERFVGFRPKQELARLID